MIIIKDAGSWKSNKWVGNPITKEFHSIDDITNDFDADHVRWMLENKLVFSRLGERYYEICED